MKDLPQDVLLLILACLHLDEACLFSRLNKHWFNAIVIAKNRHFSKMHTWFFLTDEEIGAHHLLVFEQQLFFNFNRVTKMCVLPLEGSQLCKTIMLSDASSLWKDNFDDIDFRSLLKYCHQGQFMPWKHRTISSNFSSMIEDDKVSDFVLFRVQDDSIHALSSLYSRKFQAHGLAWKFQDSAIVCEVCGYYLNFLNIYCEKLQFCVAALPATGTQLVSST